MPNPELHKRKSSNNNQEQTIPKKHCCFEFPIPDPEKNKSEESEQNFEGIYFLSDPSIPILLTILVCRHYAEFHQHPGPMCVLKGG